MKRVLPLKMMLSVVGVFAVIFLLAGCETQTESASAPTETPLPTAVDATAPAETAPTPTTEPTSPPPTASPTAPTAAPTAAAVVEEPTAMPPTPTIPASCAPTPPDALGPFYVPNAPVRTSVGQGHVLRGVVRSSAGCAPIPNAQIEFWQVGPNGQYDDAHRATLFADEAGEYTFESNFPPAYSGRPPHIHLKVTAEGYETLVTQYYPADNQTEGMFDLVLVPLTSSGGSDGEAVSSVEPENVLPQPTLFDVSWDDRALFRSGLISSEQDVVNQLPDATVYHLDLNIADNRVDIEGREEIHYTNQEQTLLDELYLRLFPNLAKGTSTVSNVTVNGQPVEPTYELQNSAIRLPLSPALQPGEQVAIQLDFAVKVPSEEGGNYGTFGLSEGVMALAHVYPMIPVFDDEGWNVEIAPAIGDVIYADSSFYLVRVTAPAAQTVVASGIELERAKSGDRQIVTFAAGPIRDFYIAASDRYTVLSRTVGETQVNSYAPTELVTGAGVVLDQAANALESFNRRFGRYPFTEFDIVATTNFALGVEYPGVIAILLDLYDQSAQVRGAPTSALLEPVVAHEVAHQWFYSEVGNDQVDEPWLDEALAQYLTILYFADVHGQSSAENFRRSVERRWERVGKADIRLGRPVRDYAVEEYGGIVYGRGPLFIVHLAETMGQETFAAFLRDYYQRHKWGIATGESFKELAEQHCNCDLTASFEAWVYPQEG